MEALVVSEENNSLPSMGESQEWIQQLMDKVHESVTTEEKQKLEEILKAHSDCFSLHEYDLGRTAVVKHQIDTGSSRPVKQMLR